MPEDTSAEHALLADRHLLRKSMRLKDVSAGEQAGGKEGQARQEKQPDEQRKKTRTTKSEQPPVAQNAAKQMDQHIDEQTEAALVAAAARNKHAADAETGESGEGWTEDEGVAGVAAGEVVAGDVGGASAGGGARDEAARDTDATAVEEASVAERADGSAPARDDTAACHGLNLQGRPSRRRATILIYCTWGSGTATCTIMCTNMSAPTYECTNKLALSLDWILQ